MQVIEFRNIFIVFGVLFLFAGCFEKKNTAENIKMCERIVSTAPSITETLFELGLGDRVVGVTDNCKFPKIAGNIHRVGKVLDISSESVLSLKPDTVIVLDVNESLVKKMNSLKIRTMVLDQSTIEGFMFSLNIIGDICSVQDEADALADRIEEELKSAVEGFSPEMLAEKIMIVAGRDYSSGTVKDVYIAGRDGFYDEILKITGLQNAYRQSLSYPKIQVEGIIALNPDVIIDVVTMPGITDERMEQYRKSWDVLKDVNAVKNGRVFMVNKNHWSVPSPGFVNIIKDLKGMLER